MKPTNLPNNWPRDYLTSGHLAYEKVMQSLINDTQALAGDVPAWVEAWSDSIGAAIMLAFVIGARWKEKYPDEPLEVPDEEPAELQD